MDKRKADQEKDLIEVERESIVVLKETFSDIKEVKIDKTGHNQSTGSYRIFVKWQTYIISVFLLPMDTGKK